ncbi:MAG: glycine cleavage system aminomethyltransferase GcvT [Dehalococcoidia bacterium]|nr:glycine cleavage system aminomethyltransferase GcvT [Dehalococcoidia bacterium]
MALKRGSLYPLHRQAGAQMVEFSGWELPVQFNSILEEHRAVRSTAGLFDVSHLGRIVVRGPGAFGLLQKAFTNDLTKARSGRAQYTLMCKEDGGILDDLVVYHRTEDEFLLALNAANTESDTAWIRRLASDYEVSIEDRTAETVMLALQGPESATLLARLAPPEVTGLPRFGCREEAILGKPVWFSRTGYTGEDGFELVADAEVGETAWRAILGFGVKSCGLGARDTLRLEAALALYGNELDPRTHPHEAGLEWVVALGKGDFIGREALLKDQERSPQRRLVCFRMLERAVPRSGYSILVEGREVGRVTSGNYSPVLRYDIGMGYVPAELSAPDTELDIHIRDKFVRAKVVARPFYKRTA